MPYVDSELALDRLSEFIREEVRPEFEETDQLLHAQLGSLSSTLSFISKEQRARRGAVSAQRDALRDAVEAVDERLAEIDGDSAAVEEALSRASDRLEAPPSSDSRDTEQELLSLANEILETIDAELDRQDASRARRPVYTFLRARVESQFEMVGRTA